MAISVVQTCNSAGNSPSFASSVTVGNTVIYVLQLFGTGTLNCTSATLGGSQPTGSFACFNPGGTGGIQSSNTTPFGFISIWVLPNIQSSGQTALSSVFVTNGGGVMGSEGYEIAGLGTSPVTDQIVSANGRATTVNSGTTGAILAAPEIAVGTSALPSGGLAGAPSGWTTVTPGNSAWSGYQIATVSGGTFNWTQGTAPGDWAAGIATIAVALPPGAVLPAPPARPGRTWLRRYHHPQQALAPLGPQSVNAPAGLATGTATAQGAIASVGVNANLAAGYGLTAEAVLDQAGNPVLDESGFPVLSEAVTYVSEGINAGLATGTGAAEQPTVTTSGNTNAPAGLATGTGTAQNPTVAITANAGLATGTGTAQSPLAASTANAGLATGTGTAQSPIVAITVNAGLATGTGTAQNPTVSTSSSQNAPAGLATGTGTAQAPVVAVTVNAGLATGTGTASAAGHGTIPGLATGTAAAQTPALAIAAQAQAALALATALNATGASVEPFTTGTLTIADAPTAVLSAGTQRTGGPS